MQKTNQLIVKTASPNEFLEALDKLSADVKHIESSVYKTGTAARIAGTDVQSCTSIEDLVKCYSFVDKKEQFYKEAQGELGLETLGVFKEGGHTAAEWKHDIKLRIDMINTKEKRDAINEMRKEAKELMTNEDKKELLAKKLAAFSATV